MSRAARWALLALAGTAILDVDVFVHEILGHGLAAAIFGAMPRGIYVSPLVGYAIGIQLRTLEDWQALTVLAAGPLATGILGIATWWAHRRARLFTPRAILLLFAAYNVMTFLIYAGLQPLLEPLSGGPPQGDVAVIFAVTGVPALPVAVLALALGSVVIAELMRDIRAFVVAELAPEANAFTAAWLLVLPSVLLVSGYYVAVFPRLIGFERFAWPSGVASALVLTLGGALVLRARRSRARDVAPRMEDPLVAPAILASAAVCAIVLAIFGPTAT